MPYDLLGLRVSHITPQNQSVQACAPCSTIQRRTSSTRQTVTRGESFTGAGNVPATTRRHKVDLDMGTKVNTWGCRRKPVSGRVALVDSVVDMILLSPARAGWKKVTRSVATMLGQFRMVGRDFKARQHTLAVPADRCGLEIAFALACMKRHANDTINNRGTQGIWPRSPTCTGLGTAWIGREWKAGIDCDAAAPNATGSALFEHCSRNVVRPDETVNQMRDKFKGHNDSARRDSENASGLEEFRVASRHRDPHDRR